MSSYFRNPVSLLATRRFQKAMAGNPKLRIIRITDGSLLDAKNLEIVREMAGSRDFQVWIERVDESGKVGIYLEDGAVVADNRNISS